ncbi:MAG: hypothetical protein MUF24_02475 [Chitinophagaceae bacterium]|jgi:hypothetical protein|nr:hypothetical protein [Chitinophagaceae bacterium]
MAVLVFRNLRMLSCFLLLTPMLLPAQSLKKSAIGLFQNQDSTCRLMLSSDVKLLRMERNKKVLYPADICLLMHQGDSICGKGALSVRGFSRLDYCEPPPLMVHFNYNPQAVFAKLGKLKLVWACLYSEYYNQLVVKERLVYRIWQVFSPFALKVQKVQVTFADNPNHSREQVRAGFLVEDIDDLAKRLGCREMNDTNRLSAEIDRQHFTCMSLFQYMIGNPDWSVKGPQNLKLLTPSGTPGASPFTVPYDFDQCGLVNAEYARPPVMVPIETVSQRIFKGLRRTKPEVDKVVEQFLQAEAAVYRLIESETELKPASRRDMINYLKGFFSQLKDSRFLQQTFIENQ